MRALLVGLAWFSLTVVGAHALSFAIVRLLPDPMISVLGLESANREVRAAVITTNPPTTYRESVAGFLRGDLGDTVDGTPVSTDIASAIAASLPRLAGALLLILAAALGVAYGPAHRLRRIASIAAFLAFLPPFLAPSLMLWIMLLLLDVLPNIAMAFEPWFSCFSIAFPAAAIAASQTALVTLKNRELPFAITIRSIGATETRLRTRMLHHLALELAPTLEKLLLGVFTALLFAESIFGEGGLGSLTLRAIRRSDLDMIVAIVVLTSLVVGLLRLARVMLRSAYGLKVA